MTRFADISFILLHDDGDDNYLIGSEYKNNTEQLYQMLKKLMLPNRHEALEKRVTSLYDKESWRLEKEFKYLPHYVPNYRTILMEVINRRSGLVLQYAPEELKNDLEVVKHACDKSRRAIQFCSNQQIIYQLKEQLFSISYFNVKQKDDGQTIYELKPNIFAYLKENFIDLNQLYYWIFKFADKSITDNEEIMLDFIKQATKSMEYVSERLKSDRSFILRALEVNQNVYACISDEFRNDFELISRMVERDGFFFIRLPKKYHSIKDLALSALMKGCEKYDYAKFKAIFNHIPKNLKDDVDFMDIITNKFRYTRSGIWKY